MTQRIVRAGLALAALGALPAAGAAQTPDAEALSKVVAEIESLDAMRSALARSFTGEPDVQTFRRVCRPVGARAKEIAAENGWKVAQMAAKYRNPAHKLDAEAKLAYRIMLDSPELMGLWIRTEMDGVPGFRYFRRIVVEEACLACHGAKEKRPRFVKAGYPEDRAYGFKVGDLRGVYSVFVPGG